MKKTLLLLAAALLMTACGNQEAQLKERAAELCKYIPDHELREESRDHMTEDFYNVLDTMFNHLPEFEAMGYSKESKAYNLGIPSKEVIVGLTRGLHPMYSGIRSDSVKLG